ncbi:hypothetical protein CASFOL_011039 [Castilleja foliolosa]|uniref:Transmembrane protein n=1 Tax=Castilleja foliolosa TaxID=1961234 RepID=A0ABD3DY39_9LAMI
MAKLEQASLRPWFLDLVVLLVVSHVIALVYWIYRLATVKQPPKTKRH